MMPRSPRRPQRRLALRSVTHDRNRLDAPFRFDTSYDTGDARLNFIAARRSRRRAVQSDLRHLGHNRDWLSLLAIHRRSGSSRRSDSWPLYGSCKKRGEALRKRVERVQQPPQIGHLTPTESGYSLMGDDFFAQVAACWRVRARSSDCRRAESEARPAVIRPEVRTDRTLALSGKDDRLFRPREA
jgi:hypothetical protein